MQSKSTKKEQFSIYQLRLLPPCQVCIRNSVAQTGYQDSRKASDWLYLGSWKQFSSKIFKCQ